MFLVLVSCGKPETMGRQERHRKDVAPELQGNWATNCEGSRTNQLSFSGDRLTVERTTYLDNECQEKLRTTVHAGTYQLANNYKEGIANSIVFVLDKELTVTIHTEVELDRQNSTLAVIRNEKAVETKDTMSVDQKRQINRDNQLLRAGQQVEVWARETPKKLSRLQAEKLDKHGFQAAPVAEFGARLSLKYEIDNGFLQIGGPSDFGRVFSKK